MNKEEIIENIQSYIDYLKDRVDRESDICFDKVQAQKDIESFTYAIKALEQDTVPFD